MIFFLEGGGIFSIFFVRYFRKTTRQIKMKLTKKEALVEAPDFLFSFVPAQPFKDRGGGKGWKKGQFITNSLNFAPIEETGHEKSS